MGGKTSAATKRETRARYAEVDRLEAELLASPSGLTKSRLGKALERAIRRIPQLVDTRRGQALLAMAAESRGDWEAAVSFRRMQIGYMALMRELGHTDSASGRRTILRDSSSRAFAAAYDQLAVACARAEQPIYATRARAMSRRYRSKR